MDIRDKDIQISVIVPCRNEVGAIEAFLESAAHQKDIPGEWELIVADGMSNDGTREVLHRWHRKNSRIRIVDNPALTVSCGLNKAIRAATGQIIIRMDAHTEYASDYIFQCVKALRETGAACVGGPARTRPANHYIARAIAAAYHSRFACGQARFHQVDYQGYVDTVTYGCWWKSDLERLGLFDEALVRNQDDELSLRITKSGRKIWQTPAIVSWYRPRQSLNQLFQQYFQYGFWKVAVIRKHGTPARWGHLVPGAFVLGNAAALITSLALLVLFGRQVAYWPFLVWAGALLVYETAAAIAALGTAAEHGWTLIPILPIVFATFHLGYGFGFVAGALSNPIGRSGEKLINAATELTR